MLKSSSDLDVGTWRPKSPSWTKPVSLVLAAAASVIILFPLIATRDLLHRIMAERASIVWVSIPPLPEEPVKPVPEPKPDKEVSKAASKPPVLPATPPVKAAVPAAPDPTIPRPQPHAENDLSDEPPIASDEGTVLQPSDVRDLARALPVPVASIPKPALPSVGTIEYTIVADSLGLSIGRGSLHWKIDGNRYRFELDVRSTGLARLLVSRPMSKISEGTLTATGLRPETFEVRGQHAADEDQVVRFDWDHHRITAAPEKLDQAVADGALDDISFFMQFAQIPPVRDTYDSEVTNGYKVEHYHYELVGRERLKLPMGSVSTVKVARQYRLGETPIDMWFDDKHGWLPVRISTLDKTGEPGYTLLAAEIH